MFIYLGQCNKDFISLLLCVSILSLILVQACCDMHLTDYTDNILIKKIKEHFNQTIASSQWNLLDIDQYVKLPKSLLRLPAQF